MSAYEATSVLVKVVSVTTGLNNPGGKGPSGEFGNGQVDDRKRNREQVNQCRGL